MNIDENRGKRLAYGIAILFSVVLIATTWNFHDKHGDDSRGVHVEDLITAYEAGDDRQLSVYAQKLGMKLETLKEVARGEIEHAAHMKVLKEREKTLGTWEEAIKTGTLLHNSKPDAEGDISAFYDINADGIADFEIAYRDNKPFAWRFLDEKGDAYG